MNITTQFEVITPDKAKRMLDFNTGNRPVSEKNLKFLIQEMKTDKFHLTGESIKIASDGTLIDGQHRLMAVVESKKSVKMLVIRGLSTEAFKYIDTGKTRSAGDVLAIEGIPNSVAMASIAKFISAFQKGKYSASTGKGHKDSHLKNHEVSDFVNKHKESLTESFKYGYNKHNKIVSRTYLSGFHFIFDKISPIHADDFCHKLATGIDLKPSSPIHLLRQKLIADIRSTRKMKSVEKIALICKAWNAYRNNKSMTLLKWDSIKESFPKPI